MRTLLLLALFAISFCAYSQTCPASIKTTGGSTPSNPTFVLNNGQSCTGWPATITVNTTLTYNFVSCSGVNLKYTLASGTPPADYAMIVDFGGGLVCEYDSNGDYLGTLSNKEFDLKDSSLHPNPSNGEFLTIDFPVVLTAELRVYSITGKLLVSESITNSKSCNLNLNNLNQGIYLVQIESNNATFTKRLIVQ